MGMARHPEESDWLAYSMKILADRLGGEPEEYQLEALLAVRKALHGNGPQKAFVIKASKWAAANVAKRRARRQRAEDAFWLLNHASDDSARPSTKPVRGILNQTHPAMLRYLVGDMSDRVAASCMGTTPKGLRNRVYRLREKYRAA